MSRMLLAGMIGLGLTACSGALAGEPEHAERWQLGHRALDRTLVVGTLIEATIQPGAPLTATVSADVKNAHRWVVIPAGCPVGVKIALLGLAADKSQADAKMLLDVTSVTVWGQVYPVSATVEVTPTAVRGVIREVVVAPGTRILFVLPEGLTVERPRGEVQDVYATALSRLRVASSFDAQPIRAPAHSC
ncbi:MAG TPA: hypothetical protein VNH14_11155 [Gemmatimonadales bacterium]|nr:hypothetical protein [Gemmatimonadales bacterium]